MSIRVASPRHYLMCRPSYFEVTYAINPWMHPDKPVDVDAAVAQWDTLRQIYLDLGHQVSLIDPIEGLPDMVFAANGAAVVDGLVFGARFRHDERAAEADAYTDWFEAHRFELGLTGIHRPVATVEGEGDLLVAGPRVLAGTGFRTDIAAHAELAGLIDRPVITLHLVDPSFYHLDTALAVLDDDTVAFLPEAFTPDSAALVRSLFSTVIEADADDAGVLGLNAVSDGRNVVLPAQAVGLARKLDAAGFEPVLVDLSELRKAGGGPKCCTLELRGARA